MNNYAELFESIIHKFNSDFEQVKLILRQAKKEDDEKKKTGYDSIVIFSDMTEYRPKVEGALFCRIKETGKKPYFSFRSKYKYWFERKGVESWSIKSDEDFFRISPLDFLQAVNENEEDFSRLAAQICLDAMCFPVFGCCHLYKKCSDAGKCLHSDQLYATSCSYRKNLDSGRIFYGKNRKGDTHDEG